MKRVLAFICALMLIMGYATCESQVSPEESTVPITEVTETLEESSVEEPVIEEPEIPLKESPPIEEEETEASIEEEPSVELNTATEPTVELEPVIETEVNSESQPEPEIEESPVEEPQVEELVQEVISPVEEVEEQEEEISSNLVEFEEDDWGEITIEMPREVYISFLQEPHYYGDTAVLVATLVNFKPEDRYTMNWQYSDDGIEWHNIEGEDERTYTFIITKENYHYSYRVVVLLEGE